MLQHVFADSNRLPTPPRNAADFEDMMLLPDTIPRHVAIIMDGNGRWANTKGLLRSAGHDEGAKTLKTLVKAASSMGLEALTVYAFSTENWKRPPAEVDFIMKLFTTYLQREIEELHQDNIRISFIGRRDRLSPTLLEQMDYTAKLTAGNMGLHFNVAIDYGGQDEIMRAVKSLAQKVKDSEIESADIDEKLLESLLDTAALPPVDLLIRTSGDMRLSNFLLWQTAYAELWFTDTNWPDFSPAEFRQAIIAFSKRERRFGGV